MLKVLRLLGELAYDLLLECRRARNKRAAPTMRIPAPLDQSQVRKRPPTPPSQRKR